MGSLSPFDTNSTPHSLVCPMLAMIIGRQFVFVFVFLSRGDCRAGRAVIIVSPSVRQCRKSSSALDGHSWRARGAQVLAMRCLGGYEVIAFEE